MVSCIVFDLDGVVYLGAKGIPGVAAEIERLKEKVKVLFLTNNATRSRIEYVRHLERFGIHISIDDVMTSSYGCAKYILENFGERRKVFPIGEQGLLYELEGEARAEIVEGGAEIVVCGLDRKVDYDKLNMAFQNLLGGAKFILANNDPTLPTESGISLGSGAIAASLSFASGRKPDAVIGKPSLYMIKELLKLHDAKPSDSAFVGDRLDMDIRMANEAGMKSVLVLTGVTKIEDAKKAKRPEKPDIVIESAAEVGKALGI